MVTITVDNLPEDKWRDYVYQHPASNIFHTPEMYQVFAHTKGHKPMLWAATDNDQILALFQPIKITLKDGVFRYLTTRAVSYGSVLYTPTPEGRNALQELLKTYTQQVDSAVIFTELRNLSDLEATQPILAECEFIYEDHLDYLVNLNLTPEEVFENIGKRTRKNIRRGLRKAEVIIEEVHTSDQLLVLYELLQKTYAAAHVPLADWSLFKAAFDVLHPQNMAKFLLARVEDNYAACSVELVYKDTIYGWYGGMDRDYSSYIPNELMIWYILEWGAENSYRIYDFGGAGKPDEEYPVRDFKAKFGGDLVCYGRNTYVHANARLGLSKLGYAAYQKLYGTFLIPARESKGPQGERL